MAEVKSDRATGNYGQGNSKKRQKDIAQQQQASSPYAPKSNPYAGGGAGYQGGGAFGVAKPPKQAAAPNKGGWDSFFRATKNLTDQAKRVALNAQNPPQPLQTQDNSTPFDDLAALIGGGGSFDPNSIQVDTSAYDNQERTARQNGADADVKLQAMYRQLAQSYLDDNANTKSAYAQSAANLGQASDQAANEVKQAAQTSTSDLIGMLSKLGIQDTGRVLANKGTTIAGDTNATLNGIAANKGANLAANEANSAAAQEYNRNISSAANLEGTTQRAENQQNLSKVLQSIASARTNAVNQAKQSAAQAAASSQGDAFSNALQLAQAQQKYRGDEADRQLQAQQLQSKSDASDFSAAQGLNKQSTSKSSAVASAIANFMRNGMSYEDALKRAQALFGK